MKTSQIIDFKLLAVVFLITACRYTQAQNSTAAPDPAAAKIKERWSKPLNDARQDFESSNDRESAGFVTEILDSLDRPGGLSSGALGSDLDRIKRQVRELVRQDSLASAASLNWAQVRIVGQSGSGASGPLHPHQKGGGVPGPGGLVLYFPFDQPDEAGVTYDESGAGNDGQVSGAQWVAVGKFGGAYRFAITNLSDRIVVPNSDTLNPDAITVAAWVKTADRDGFWNRIVDKDYRNGYCLSLGGYAKGQDPRGKLEFGTSRGYVRSDHALDDNQWHHVAGTYDGRTVRGYVDGVEKNWQVKAPGPLKHNEWDLCIGNSVVEYSSGEFMAFNGLIDEVRIYNRALSPAEIKALASATSAGVDPVNSSPETGVKPEASERLKKVKSLYDQGLINKDDYDKKVKEIMDSL